VVAGVLTENYQVKKCPWSVILLDPEEEGTTVLRNVDKYLPVDTACNPEDYLQQHHCENLTSKLLLMFSVYQSDVYFWVSNNFMHFFSYGSTALYEPGPPRFVEVS
jgi:hypothetical protein